MIPNCILHIEKLLESEEKFRKTLNEEHLKVVKAELRWLKSFAKRTRQEEADKKQLKIAFGDY